MPEVALFLVVMLRLRASLVVEEEKWHHPLSVAYRYIATAGALLNILVFLGTIGASYAKYMEHNSDGYTPPM